VEVTRVRARLNFMVWVVGSCCVFFFYERKMGKETGSGHWTMFIVVVMVCI
jgi:hypothetical protein